MNQSIKIALVYIFAIVSALVPMLFIRVLLDDFFNPNSITFQMIDLPESQILLFDGIVLAGYAILYAWLIIAAVKKNTKKMMIVGAAIWIYSLIMIFIDGNLPHYNV